MTHYNINTTHYYHSDFPHADLISFLIKMRYIYDTVQFNVTFQPYQSFTSFKTRRRACGGPPWMVPGHWYGWWSSVDQWLSASPLRSHPMLDVVCRVSQHISSVWSSWEGAGSPAVSEDQLSQIPLWEGWPTCTDQGLRNTLVRWCVYAIL